jgi:hypothetical protein
MISKKDKAKIIAVEMVGKTEQNYFWAKRLKGFVLPLIVLPLTA